MHSQIRQVRSSGCLIVCWRVFGRVSSVESDSVRHDRQYVEVTLGNSPESLALKRKWGDRWNLQASAKAIQSGDLICLARGSSKPMIVRACTDYSAIVLISVTHSHSKQTSGVVERRESSLSFAGSPRELLLVWDWGKPPKVESEFSKYGYLLEIDGLAPQYSNEPQSKALRLLNMGVILGGSGECDEADKTLIKAIRCYEDAFGEDDLQTIAAVDRVAMIYREQQNWLSAESLLTRAIRSKRKIKGFNHPDTLSSVASLLLLHAESASLSKTGRKAMVELAERIKSNAAVTVAGTACIA
jgi:hypothetical protein